MTDSARIILVGKSTESLLAEIAEIRAWDNGHNYPIKAAINDGNDYKFDSIDNVENAIKNNLAEYIEKGFILRNKVLKTGGNSDLYLVDNPDTINDEGKFKKVRNRMTHLTPKKKKRK